MGTDLRKAVLDGWPASRADGADLFPEFIDTGYQLWSDRSSCRIKFIQGDIFTLSSPTPTPTSNTTFDLQKISYLCDLAGRVKYLFTGSVFHLFGEEKQKEMALNLVSLLKREPGSIMFGRHTGAAVKGAVPTSRVYVASSAELWDFGLVVSNSDHLHVELDRHLVIRLSHGRICGGTSSRKSTVSNTLKNTSSFRLICL